MTRSRIGARALLLLCAHGSFLFAGSGDPDARHFRKALVCLLPPGHAETVIAPNPIEAALADGSWKQPEEGLAVAFPGGYTTTWKTVHANAKGWFEGDAFNGCYVQFSFDSPERQVMILRGMGNENTIINGTYRSGNPYGLKDVYEAWEPRFDYSLLPVVVLPGRNEILMRAARGTLKADLDPAPAPVFLNERDVTVPDLVRGSSADMWAAIVIVNATESTVRSASLSIRTGTGPSVDVAVPVLPPASVRKVGFPVRTGPSTADSMMVRVILNVNHAKADERSLKLRVVGPLENRRETFVSGIDGSVQYYGFLPASPATAGPKALLLSLHGASVEAINQTASYAPKTWMHIAAPTNRRPYGFNWEDWGRLDAMEVLRIVKQRNVIDEDRVYLAGHSMGGHGTWHIGAMFPDAFAAIGPSAGWISFWTYRIKGQMDTTAVRRIIRRTTTMSETFNFVENYKPLGVYIIHGSADDNVLPDESRAMVERLSKVHRDFVYHEEAGAGHWWDNSDEPGADCVDWAPMFDFFARHARPGMMRVRELDFSTADPSVSSRDQWLTIEAQERQCAMSRVRLRVDPFKRRIVGVTDNVHRLSIDCTVLAGSGEIQLDIDSQRVAVKMPAIPQLHLVRTPSGWREGDTPSAWEKGPARYGTFKEVFVRRVELVYGTQGSAGENTWAYDKARFDAEKLWYQGNGSVDVVADTEFHHADEPDRSIVLYGNASTNAAWPALLGTGPVQCASHAVRVGTAMRQGDDVTCFLVRPRPGSATALVAAVGGTGLVGMRAANRVPYASPGINLPNCTIMSADVLKRGDEGVLVTGFFGLDWSLAGGDFAGSWHIQ